ncbi:MAG TPA: leucine--tRNA ligase, partial [Rectinema sp.]|nr:leucine--tRNA ligase [Rectinema sp.]
EEIWEWIGNSEMIVRQSWPSYDPSLIKSDTVTVVVQINGKLRDRIEAPSDIEDEALKKMAVESEKVALALAGVNPKKIIVIPKKLVNIVI